MENSIVINILNTIIVFRFVRDQHQQSEGHLVCLLCSGQYHPDAPHTPASLHCSYHLATSLQVAISYPRRLRELVKSRRLFSGLLK